MMKVKLKQEKNWNGGPHIPKDQELVRVDTKEHAIFDINGNPAKGFWFRFNSSYVRIPRKEFTILLSNKM